MKKHTKNGTRLRVFFIDNEQKYFKILVVFLLMQPVIDVLTSLGVRYAPGVLSIGMIVRSIFLLFSIGFILLYLAYKPGRKSILIYMVVLFGYVVLFFISVLLNPDLRLMDNVKEMLKIIYFPVTMVVFSLCIDKSKIEKLIGYMVIVFYIYSFVIFLGSITKTGFSTYGYLDKGNQGWFYAGNEVSAILSFLIPVSVVVFLDWIVNKKKLTLVVFSLTGLFLVIFVNIQMGTKALIANTIFILIVYGLINVFQYFKKRQLFNILKTAVLLMMVVAIIVGLKYSPMNSNINTVMNKVDNAIKTENQTPAIEEKVTETENQTPAIEEKVAETENQTPPIEEKVAESENETKVIKGTELSTAQRNSKIYNIVNALLSNRLVMARPHYEAFINSPLLNKAFGIGYYPEGTKLNKLVEVDILSLLFRQGVIGLVVILLPYFTGMTKAFSKMLRKHNKPNIKIFALGYAVIMTLGFALITGHVFVAPSVSFFVSLITVALLRNADEEGLFQIVK
ncbi:MAG: O-antigen ligase family protein [Clostridiaceae bacterium]